MYIALKIKKYNLKEYKSFLQQFKEQRLKHLLLLR